MKTYQLTVLLLIVGVLLGTHASAKESTKNKPYDHSVFEYMAECTVLLIMENENRKRPKRVYEAPATLASYTDLDEMIRNANVHAGAYEMERNNASVEEAKARLKTAGENADKAYAKAITTIIDSPIKDKVGVVASLVESRTRRCEPFYEIISRKGVSNSGEKKK